MIAPKLVQPFTLEMYDYAPLAFPLIALGLVAFCVGAFLIGRYLYRFVDDFQAARRG